MLLLALEYLVMATVLAGVITQVIAPILKGDPLFPILRSNPERELRREFQNRMARLAKLKLEDQIAGLELEIETKKVEQLRKQLEPSPMDMLGEELERRRREAEKDR
ncbi:MAG TPA: hypothetical protein VI953_00050 [Candidatus Paceibacterota bacterium]